MAARVFQLDSMRRDLNFHIYFSLFWVLECVNLEVNGDETTETFSMMNLEFTNGESS